MVTDKAISRWETGKGLPDTSLLKPLGDILGISVSESPLGAGLSLRLYGRHPLQGQGGSPLCDQGGLCGAWHHLGRKKCILGVWIGEHESSKFWLNALNDLKSRGVLDIYLFCTDGLCGMVQASQTVYPKSRLQRCIVHQIRSSTKYVSYKDLESVIADLKKVYTAVTLKEAEENLCHFSEV